MSRARIDRAGRSVLRPLPSDLQTEQNVLGVILRIGEQEHGDGDPVDVVTRVLEAKHFADPVHGSIYAEILRRIEANERYSAKHLAQAMGSSGVLDEVGGSAYLSQLASTLTEIWPLGVMAGRIVHAWRGREAIVAGEAVWQHVENILHMAFRDGGVTKALADVLNVCVAALDNAKINYLVESDTLIVDGHMVNMTPPWATTTETLPGGLSAPNGYQQYVPPPFTGDVPLDSDIYGEHMLMKTTLDREEVLVLSEFHQAAQKRGLILVRVAERDYHQKRLNHFSDALLELDPMDPAKPRSDKMEWDL